GPAGAGKSRLCREHVPPPIAACSLSAARSADDIHYAIAGALGVELGGSMGPAVDRALERCASTVVLDGADRAVAALRTILLPWLSASSRARFVVTARRALGLPGERTIELGPLAEPDALALWAWLVGKQGGRSEVEVARAIVTRLD